MTGGSRQYLGRILQIHVNRTGEEITTGTQRQLGRDKRIFHRPIRRTLGYETTVGCRGVLSLRQTIDLIVEKNDIQIDITTDSVDKMITADSQAVAITRNQPYAQVRASRLYAGSDSRSTTMDRMEAIRIHIIR